MAGTFCINSCILLPWVFRETSSDAIRSSAITILSRICEDYGPSSIPISQGWLAIMLSDILKSRKLSLKGSAQPRDKVKVCIIVTFFFLFCLW